MERIEEQNEYRSIDNIDDYQQKIEQFVIYPREHAYNYLSLGLASEAGEVASIVKKVIRDSAGAFSDDAKLALLKELGDVVWYVAAFASEIGVDMSEILAENYYKLEFRAQRGVLGGSGDNR
jgi:NTP pyrophosphatase (non-canonical NTP hydrolase)